MLERAAPTPFPTQRSHDMKFGTQITVGGTRFRLWAPKRRAVALKLERKGTARPMRQLPRGWFELDAEGVGDGDLYRFELDDGTLVPDPASRFQPQDVLGPSEVIDPRRFPWTDVGWAGRPWHEAILYELHLGTFTPEGTYLAAIERLDYLVELGITTIQLMPVNAFPGRWNWGYDGSFPFAPDASYGRPEDLKQLIAAAHERSLMVLLDVVYNHFGPSGNFLPLYAPVFTARHSTPWGDAINFDGEGSPMVRDLVLANARYWLDEYHFDGLRLDAIHEMKDHGFHHLLHDLALQVRGATDGRHVHLVVENENNDPGWLRRTGDLSAGLYDAQWNDDIHHLIDVRLFGEQSSYHRDYGAHPEWLGRALTTGFAFQGEILPTRGKPKGGPSAELPPVAFVSFVQNHDQVGNRLFGERFSVLTEPHQRRAVAALYLLAPQIPMLFMGEEWDCRVPFLFFSDVGEEFRDAIIADRKRTFGQFVLPQDRDREPPDPMAESSFVASKLDWQKMDEAMASLYRELLAVRRTEIVPRLGGVPGNAGRSEPIDGCGTKAQWTMDDGSLLSLFANLSDRPLDNIELPPGRTLWLEGSATAGHLDPWSVLWRLTEARTSR